MWSAYYVELTYSSKIALTSHANVAGNVAEKANLAGYVQVTCQNVVGNRQVTGR